jgi:hypothetical protein
VGGRPGACFEAARLTLPEYRKHQSPEAGLNARLFFLLARLALMMRIASPSPNLLIV